MFVVYPKAEACVAPKGGGSPPQRSGRERNGYSPGGTREEGGPRVGRKRLGTDETRTEVGWDGRTQSTETKSLTVLASGELIYAYSSRPQQYETTAVVSSR